MSCDRQGGPDLKDSQHYTALFGFKVAKLAKKNVEPDLELVAPGAEPPSFNNDKWDDADMMQIVAFLRGAFRQQAWV